MLSLVIGCALGLWVSRTKTGLAVVVLYGVVTGFVASNVSYRDGAGLMPIVWALLGFGLARLFVAARRTLRAKVVRGQPEPVGTKAATPRATTRPREVSTDRESVYTAAGLAHATFLNARGEELTDAEFVATAFGAFDGTLQALGRELSDLDMLAMSSAFALRQMNDLQRMGGKRPAEKGDVIGQAVTAPSLEGLRTQAGWVAYTVTKNSTMPGAATP